MSIFKKDTVFPTITWLLLAFIFENFFSHLMKTELRKQDFLLILSLYLHTSKESVQFQFPQ